MTKRQREFASTTNVAAHRAQVSMLSRLTASTMKEPDESEEERLRYAFVSDESRLADFLSDNSALLQLRGLTEINGLEMLDLISEAAVRLPRTSSHQ